MANFDSDTWYRITTSDLSSRQSFGCGGENAAGAVFMQTTNLENNIQQWQILASTEDTFIFRNHFNGPSAVLGVFCANTTNCENDTPAAMRLGEISDPISSQKWNLAPANDGSFFMTNQANGTGLFFKVRDNSNLVWMREGLPSSGWAFSSISRINNGRFSTSSTQVSESLS